MKPYKFDPYLKTTLWGGYQIAPFKGIYTAQPNIGESWEISGVPGHESVAIERGIIDDVDVGMTLTQLIDKYNIATGSSKTALTTGNTDLSVQDVLEFNFFMQIPCGCGNILRDIV